MIIRTPNVVVFAKVFVTTSHLHTCTHTHKDTHTLTHSHSQTHTQTHIQIHTWTRNKKIAVKRLKISFKKC
jgi:hypothetical protein